MKKILCMLLLAFSLSAFADVDLGLSNWQYSGNGVNVTWSGGTYTGEAGAFKGSLSGAGVFDSPSFITYCVELDQHFGWSSNLTGYNIVSPAAYTSGHPNGWGANSVAIGNRLGQLLTYSLPLVNDAAMSTSLQLAIWNTIYDTDSTVSSGSFTDTSIYAAQANAFLSGSSSSTNIYQIGVLNNASSQDFIAYAPVPEPSTGLMMLSGFMAGVFVLKRRAPK